MSVLGSPTRIGDDSTEAVLPNSKVTIVFFADNIHGFAASLSGPGAPTVSIEWIGKSLFYSGNTGGFNSAVPIFHDMIHQEGPKWTFVFVMVGYSSFEPSPADRCCLCVEAAARFDEFIYWRRRYCIPPIIDKDDIKFARRRFPRRRWIPTPDTTGSAKDRLNR